MIKKRKTIFIVDDNNANLVSCKNILKSYYEIFPIPSAAKMFVLLDRVIPDLILLDVEMPDINGYEAAQMLKDGDETKNIPIMFLSAKSDPTSEMEGLNLGALDYIHKPFVSALLLRRIETHLSLIEYRTELEERNYSIEKLLELKTKEVIQHKSAEAMADKTPGAAEEFLPKIIQEMNSPLNAIISELSAAAAYDDQDKIKKSAQNANVIARELLKFINDIQNMQKAKYSS